VYNKFLELRRDAWKEGKKSLAYKESSALLTTFKEQFPWLKEPSSVCLQQALRHLDKAFRNFFTKLTKYPSFKKKNQSQSSSYMKTAFTYKKGEIQLAKHKEPLKIRWSRSFLGEPTSLTITRESAGRYYISIHVKEEVNALPFKKGEIGIDLGITNLITDDKGNTVDNLRCLKKCSKKLIIKQKALSRKKLGSKNREKAKTKMARLHARIRDKRHDFYHKLSRAITSENQVIVVEDLKVKNMSKNRRLARSIADVSWSTLVRFLEYKCEWYGKKLIKIDSFFPSSKLCSHCNHHFERLELSMRRWECPRSALLVPRHLLLVFYNYLWWVHT